MAREGAESRLRLQEDQLAELQEELRRVAEISPSDSLQTVLKFCTMAYKTKQHHSRSIILLYLSLNLCKFLSAGCSDSADRAGGGCHVTAAPRGDTPSAGAGADCPEGGSEGGGGVP